MIKSMCDPSCIKIVRYMKMMNRVKRSVIYTQEYNAIKGVFLIIGIGDYIERIKQLI